MVVLLWYKISRLFTDGWRAILVVGFTMSVYLIFNQEGNLTEDWCMLPISYSMYLLARMVRDESTPRPWEYFIAGLGAGAVTMIRMNNMPITVVLACYTLYYLVKAKDYRRLCLSALLMFVGFLLPILAFYVYFYVRWGSLGTEWFIYGTFWYNLDYAKNHDGATTPLASRIAYWVSVVLLIVVSRKMIIKDRRYLVLSVVLYAFSFMVMGKSLYMHYFMITLPIVVMSASFAFCAKDEIIIVGMLVGLIANAFTGYKNMKYLTTNGDIYPADFYEKCDSLIKKIPQGDRDSIFNYNDEFGQVTILKRNEIMQCNRLNGLMILKLSGKLYRETRNQLFEMSPKWVLCSRDHWTTDRDSVYMTRNYKLVDRTDYDNSRDFLFCHAQMKLYRRIK